MKEASSSEAPQKRGPVRTYSDFLEKPRSESLATHQRKCLRALDPHMIIELEVDLNRCSNLWLIVVYLYIYAYFVGLMVYIYI